MPNYDQHRIPKEAPLPCFGLEFEADDTRCQACPHQEECRLHMGTRLNRHSLSHVVWNLVPEKLGNFQTANLENDATLRAAYTDAHEIVFDRKPPHGQSLGKKWKTILANAQALNMDVRLYMAAAMVGWKQVNQVHQQESQSESVNMQFSPSYLSTKMGYTSAKTYAEECRRQFSMFSVSALGLLDNDEMERRSLENKILHSEVAAAKFIISYKLNCGGPAMEDLYKDMELELDPHWLALEKSYFDIILSKHIEKAFGTGQQRFHRRSVGTVLAFLKKYKGEARYAFMLRQEIMPRAVVEVLHYFGYEPDDFNAPKEPVTDTIRFWTQLGRAMVHFNCWLLVSGEPHSIYRE